MFGTLVYFVVVALERNRPGPKRQNSWVCIRRGSSIYEWRYHQIRYLKLSL